MFLTSHRRPPRPREGIAAVEFACILPLLVILILGVWELGRMIQIYQVAANAAREGARQASTAKYTNDEVRQAVFEYLQRNGVRLHPTLAPSAVTLSNTNCTITVTAANGSNQTFDADQGVPVSATVSIPMSNFKWLLGYVFVAANTEVSCSAGLVCLKDQPLDVPVTIPQAPLN